MMLFVLLVKRTFRNPCAHAVKSRSLQKQQRFERSLHLRQQGTESAYEESIRLEKIALRNRVTQVIDKSPRNSYLCVLQDGTCEWISFLQCDDALVKQYEEEVDNIVVNDVFTLDDKQLWESRRKRKNNGFNKIS